MSIVDIPADADVSWMKRAICQGIDDPSVFFPPYDAPSSNEFAKAICKRCPVQGECLDWALAYDEDGVWGGTGEADRRALKRRKSRTECVVCESEDILVMESNEICLGCGTSWKI